MRRPDFRNPPAFWPKNSGSGARLALLLLLALLADCSGGLRPNVSRYPQHRGGEGVYVADKGDTLEDVAKKFETTVEALKKENNLTKDTLAQGQRITIPHVPPEAFISSDAKSEAKKEEAVQKESPRPEVKQSPPRVKGARPPSSPPKIDVRLAWPVEKAAVISEFGIRKNGKHDGVDLGAPEGAKISAAADGTVIFSGQGPSGYGNIVVLKHSESVVTIYAHNSKNLVEKGGAVKQGDPIALVGRTGRATRPHLHFEVRVNRVAFDPLEYLPKK
ncbi:MAG: LysM peptidoglycan-binding domain-containing M23 family metallopeptidase [Nitrospinae bacterium]|nr:LysM peptidoglycan-binding domain-containing M23 family metallopeptidase [Nitrospinota bacterium]